jgi:hypothetical protein
MPATGTLEDLGNAVKQKYPGSYDSYDPVELGKAVQKKYPGAYDGFIASQSSSAPDDPGAPDYSASRVTAQPLQPQPSSIPGPGAGSPSASGFDVTTPSLTPPPGYHQGLFNAPEYNRRAQKQFDLQAEYAARGAEATQVSRAAIAAQREETMQRIEDMKKDGSWDKLTPRQQADVRLGAKSITPELRPQIITRQETGASILAGNPDARDYGGVPIDRDQTYTTRAMPDGSLERIQNRNTTRPILLPGSSPGTVDRVNIDTQTGKPVGEVQKGILAPAGYLPKMISVNGVQMVQQPDGSIAPVPTFTTSTSTPVMPGAPARATNPQPVTPAPALSPAVRNTPVPPATPAVRPPASGAGQPGPAVGGKSFSPEQLQAMRTQSGQIAKTMGTIGFIQDHLDLLNSLIDAKKIDFVMEPGGIVHSAIARGITLTPDERKLAGDFNSLAESINELRGPLGATGFRGQQAFERLQSQRGNLTGNPDITRQVLANTMDAFITQRDALNEGLNRGLPKPPGYVDRVRIYGPPDASGKPVTGTVERKDLADYFRKGYHLRP